MSTSYFNPDKDIRSLSGKVVFITGGTAGLGYGSIMELAKHEPTQIFFSGRNQSNAAKVIAEVAKVAPSVKTIFIKCDISSLASVKEAAATFTSQSSRLDILMLNAGIMATEATTSVDGYEMQFATNHLGHALLVKLLLPMLQSTAKLPGADVRVINMSSLAHDLAPKSGIEFTTLHSNQNGQGGMIPGGRWSRYGQSKLAQLLYSSQLAKHHPEITSVSIHPGFIMTDLFGNIPLAIKLPALIRSIGQTIPVEQGHYLQVWASTCEKTQLRNGEYYVPGGKVGDRTKLAKDEVLGEKLWDWTEDALKTYV